MVIIHILYVPSATEKKSLQKEIVTLDAKAVFVSAIYLLFALKTDL
jgi:hypothetical protein